MGTNYYWRHNICSCCARYDELHICKSFGTFRGHFSESEWDDKRRQFVYPPLIVSWAAWAEKLRSGGEVWDEYGRRHDTEEFIATAESVPAKRRRQHYDYCAEHHPPGAIGYREKAVAPDGEWLDADGYSFYGGEFS